MSGTELTKEARKQLGLVADLTRELGELEDRRKLAARAAVQAGASWAEVAAAAGMPKTTAFRRFS